MKIKSLIALMMAIALATTAIILTYQHSFFFQTWFVKLSPPPTPKNIGLSLVQLNNLKHITLYYNPLNSSERTPLHLQKLQRGWQWQWGQTTDRADNQLLASVLLSLHHLKVLDSFTLDDLQVKTQGESTQTTKNDLLNLYGINAQSIELKLALQEPHLLQRFIVGAEAPWTGTHEINEPNVTYSNKISTFYIWVPDEQKIYLVQGPKLDFLKQSPTILRDKSPFFFKKDELINIQFSSTKESWRLEKIKDQWQARKPYLCDIDPVAINKLITDLSQLKITKFYPNLNNTNYASLAKNDFYTLSLTYLVNKQKVIEHLKLIPIKDQNNTTPYWIAQSSARSGYFQIKSIGTVQEPGILNLSLHLADLRSKLLIQLPTTDIKSIHMFYPQLGTQGFSQTLIQTRPHNWQLHTQQTNAKINTIKEKPHKNKITPFLTSLLEQPTLNILSEQQANNLNSYGLDRPSLTLTISTANQSYILDIGEVDNTTDSLNRYYAKWHHLDTIFEISDQVYYHLMVEPYQWKSSKVWDFSPLAVKGIIRQNNNKKPIILNYQPFNSQWTASIGEQDLTTHLIQAEANKLLSSLSNLSNFNWLPKNHQASSKALAKPSITIDIILQDEDTPENEQFLTLWLSPTQNNQFYFFYGKVLGQGQPNFILKGETVKNLITPLFENNFDFQSLTEL